MIKACMLPDSYKSFSVTFQFKKGKSDSTILFCDTGGIMEFNYHKEELSQVYKFNNELARQPDFVVFDTNQVFSIIASTDDVLWADCTKKDEIDIDDRF